MSIRQVVCQVRVEAGADADAAELDALTRQLARELAKLPDAEVTRATQSATPDQMDDGALRAKGLSMYELGTLLVKLAPTAALLVPVVEVIKAWVVRNAHRKVTIECRGQKIELAGMSVDEMDRRVAEFRSATSGFVMG
ncbi:MAG: hypothetical protein KAY55_02985, partial [Deltaproteobacteria bacterium]|nr:hypothetical protein [Deltaproteobacteria bacterium]